ncbi:hypothetical protein chiPu_0005649 [Chiloscyllium punctatum]|uniref:Uncharacterized protein n=1 Tax=Chiloscyllium punctatum TaxID=137246 RepID=A0A401SA40_CHIPU|nr:hypothetical protein [Chiloscyllium punctatum]
MELPAPTLTSHQFLARIVTGVLGQLMRGFDPCSHLTPLVWVGQKAPRAVVDQVTVLAYLKGEKLKDGAELMERPGWQYGSGGDSQIEEIVDIIIKYRNKRECGRQIAVTIMGLQTILSIASTLGNDIEMATKCFGSTEDLQTQAAVLPKSSPQQK